MDTPNRQRPREAGTGKGWAGSTFKANNTTAAPLRAFRQELQLIMNAAHRMASGYGLAWSDYDRLHQAWTHVHRVMEAIADD